LTLRASLPRGRSKYQHSSLSFSSHLRCQTMHLIPGQLPPSLSLSSTSQGDLWLAATSTSMVGCAQVQHCQTANYVVSQPSTPCSRHFKVVAEASYSLPYMTWPRESQHQVLCLQAAQLHCSSLGASGLFCAAAAPPRGQPAAPLKLVDGKFIADRKQVNLHGVNW
jgi:hypothetical protein